MKKVLHLLSQRPSLTGSGITLDALVRLAPEAGWQAEAVVGVPGEAPFPEVGGLLPEKIHPLRFEEGELDFPVPGMSDVMPYRSTVFSTMSGARLDTYRDAWRKHLSAVVEKVRPDVIHSNHLWLLSSMVKEIAPEIPQVIQCHATGLRQMQLCPHLAGEVKAGCRRADGFVVLHQGHAVDLASALDVPDGRIHYVGSGIRDELFHGRGRAVENEHSLVYVGKFSHAKGLPWLLDALEQLRRSAFPDLVFHVAGSGAGAEAEALQKRMESLAPWVQLHGHIDQPTLAQLMRTCAVCVLPSFYEGVPLVLAEALACGCRLVATGLPGVLDQLAPAFGPALELIDPPRLEGVDTPVEEDLPLFTRNLAHAVETVLRKPRLDPESADLKAALEPFTWKAVFHRVEKVWRDLL